MKASDVHFWNLALTRKQLRLIGSILEMIKEEPGRFYNYDQNDVKDVLAVVTKTDEIIQKQIDQEEEEG